MDNEKSRADQEQQAIADARNGQLPDPSNTNQFYIDAYNYAKSQNKSPEQQQK
jgi:hypothetical protein